MNRNNYYVRIVQGARGKWRWLAYDEGGVCVAVSAVRGWDTATQAREAARLLFGGQVDIGLAESA